MRPYRVPELYCFRPLKPTPSMVPCGENILINRSLWHVRCLLMSLTWGPRAITVPSAELPWGPRAVLFRQVPRAERKALVLCGEKTIEASLNTYGP